MWLVLHSADFTPGESPQYSFYMSLSGPKDQPGSEGSRWMWHERIHIHTAMVLGGGRITSPILGRLYPEESPHY